MDRIFVRRGSRVPERAPRFNIGVTGLGRSVGTTTLATSLAFFFSEKGNSVDYIECSDPRKSNGILYDAVAMRDRFYGREFRSLYRCIREGMPVRTVRNKEQGICWKILTPEDVSEACFLNDEEKNLVMSSASGDVNVFDMQAGAGFDSLLSGMDIILVSVDPLPSRLAASRSMLPALRQREQEGAEVYWIVTREEGIPKRQIRGFLKSGNIFYMDEIPREVFYRNEYRCYFQWEDNEVKSRYFDIFTKVSHKSGIIMGS